MVCVSKTKTGLPTNIWLESVGVNKLNREGVIYIQNNYGDILCLSNELIPIYFMNEICIANSVNNTNIKYDDIQMILKYILDNIEIFLKHWNGDIDDQDVLNLLYSQERENSGFYQ